MMLVIVCCSVVGVGFGLMLEVFVIIGMIGGDCMSSCCLFGDREKVFVFIVLLWLRMVFV